ncbi:MAG: D-alanine--D-alanine ligase [Deltaproteobacteria bacterium]|nr:MAG: D-alanine--D-alanine ligase [Deltaproteobacteria bacterium]
MSKIAVLKGGLSKEREVSLVTGGAVAAALRENGHFVTEVDVDRALPLQLADIAPEVVFIALHGRWGEDGTVQGLLEIMGIPYTGSSVTASALAMDKILSKEIFTARGIHTPPFQVLGAGEEVSAIELKAPLVAKAPLEGSSLGMGIAYSDDDVEGAIRAAKESTSGVILIEKFIAGRELTVGVLEGGEPLPIVEITPESGVYDFESKYTPGKTRYTCPAKLDEETAAKVMGLGARAYTALGCSGAARTDILLDEDGKAWVLEVNTIPGMTPTSLLPKAAAAAGISFNELVERMVSEASLKA